MTVPIKGGRPASREAVLAEELGINRKAVKRIGVDRLRLMSDDARKIFINMCKRDGRSQGDKGKV